MFLGQEHNFNKYNDSIISDLNTPYDYESVMHYGPYSFNINSSVPTVTTKIPEFNEVIGRSQDLSRIDLQRLNHMYNCGKLIFYLCPENLLRLVETIPLYGKVVFNHSIGSQLSLLSFTCPVIPSIAKARWKIRKLQWPHLPQMIMPFVHCHQIFHHTPTPFSGRGY